MSESECPACDELAAELDSLRARLAAVEAERDAALADDFVIRTHEAEARLAAVEAACDAFGPCAYGNDPEDLCACLVCQVRAALRGEGDRGLGL